MCAYFSKSNKLKGIISVVLSAVILLMAVPNGISIFSKAEKVQTIPSTEVFSVLDSKFTEDIMKADFYQWNSSDCFGVCDGTKATVEEGILNVTAGTASNTRYSAHFYKEDSLNQTVSVTFGTDGSSPAASAVVWLRAGSYQRNANEKVPTGYFIQSSRSGKRVAVTVNKAYNNNGTYVVPQIGQVCVVDPYSSSQQKYLDITVQASAVYDETAKTTVITVYVYKGTTMLYSASFEDGQSELQDAGKVGFAANGNNNLTVPVKSFAYHTTDNVTNTTRYMTETSAASDGRMVGLYTVVDPTVTYQLSAYIDSDFTNEPLCVMYKGSDGQSKQLLFAPTDDGVTADSKYKKYTCIVTFSDYKLEDNVYIGSSSNIEKKLTLAYVGFAMNDAVKNNIKYTDFELRKVNEDGSLGGNILYNGDFKMGTYGWSDDINKNLWQISNKGFDATGFANNRATFTFETNNYDFWDNFVKPNYLVNDLDFNGSMDIRDLVAMHQLESYTIFADGDKNGVIDNNDEAILKKILLEKHYIEGLQKIAQVDSLSEQKKSEILSTATAVDVSGSNTYYVSANGNDSNSGTKERPWKTIDKVNEVIAAKPTGTLYTICFNRGDTFRGNIKANSNVTFTAYGSGDKPIIMGSPENASGKEKWTLVEGTSNIYKYYKDTVEVGSIFFNGDESYAAKRTPNITKDASGNYSFGYGYNSLDNMQFVCLPEPQKATTLKYSNISEVTGPLYIRCDGGNPGAIYESIEFNTAGYVIYLQKSLSNIIVDNLSVKFGGSHGIGGSEVTNLRVQNCEISYIGGAIQSYENITDNGDGTFTYKASRYGNGVEVNASCDGYAVDNCYIHNIYDTGVTHQTGSNHNLPLVFKDVSYTNNLIENCIYSVEYFAVPGETNPETATMIMDNILIENNIMRNAGSGFGATRTLDGLVWNMACHIMGWASHENQLAEGSTFIIRNNIFDRSIYFDLSKKINSSLILTAADEQAWLPEFTGNTYIHYVGSSFSYYGLTVKTGFNANHFTKYSVPTDVEKLLGDAEGEVYYVRKPN